MSLFQPQPSTFANFTRESSRPNRSKVRMIEPSPPRNPFDTIADGTLSSAATETARRDPDQRGPTSGTGRNHGAPRGDTTRGSGLPASSDLYDPPSYSAALYLGFTGSTGATSRPGSNSLSNSTTVASSAGVTDIGISTMPTNDLLVASIEFIRSAHDLCRAPIQLPTLESGALAISPTAAAAGGRRTQQQLQQRRDEVLNNQGVTALIETLHEQKAKQDAIALRLEQAMECLRVLTTKFRNPTDQQDQNRMEGNAPSASRSDDEVGETQRWRELVRQVERLQTQQEQQQGQWKQLDPSFAALQAQYKSSSPRSSPSPSPRSSGFQDPPTSSASSCAQSKPHTSPAALGGRQGHSLAESREQTSPGRAMNNVTRAGGVNGTEFRESITGIPCYATTGEVIPSESSAHEGDGDNSGALKELNTLLHGITTSRNSTGLQHQIRRTHVQLNLNAPPSALRGRLQGTNQSARKR